MSKFEELHPKPEVEYRDESQNFIDTINILYRKKLEGWLEATKYWEEEHLVINMVNTKMKIAMNEEISELEKEK